jgi:hypothetical protein
MATLLSKSLVQLLRPLLVLLVSAPLMLMILSVETEPTVSNSAPFNQDELSQIEQLLLDGAPQSPQSMSLQRLQLNADELNLLLRYSIGVMNLSPRWAARLALNENTLTSALSVNLGQRLMPLFLNLQMEFIGSGNLLKFASLQIGKLKVPEVFLQYALSRIRASLESSNTVYQDFNLLLSRVQQVTVSPDRIDVELVWDPILISNISNHAQQLFISDQDQQRIMDYYRRIGAIAAAIPSDLRAVSLNAFLVPLFTAAVEKSRSGSDPVAENRTLFQALAIYINNENIEQLIGVELAESLPNPKLIEVRLRRRQDLAQHLVAMAAITASAGADLAQMLATTKEAYDARYRSGFSFSDLAANTVGVTMAGHSTRDARSARLMQERLANLQNEADYMPTVGNNRDGLSESDFNAIYQNRSSEEYQQRLSEIQELINARPLFRDLPVR